MSRIDKMSISGIRSFGPDEQRKIQFHTPLTLILGQNGCGKTTIIESLKYISTGDMPPGASKGASFVHDPKLAGDTTVRGQIKLLFRDLRGQEIVMSRSLEVTQKAKKMECKTIDATMCKRSQDGQVVNLSSKCSDFEAMMATALGVSKPILNNVIFCHQEDSNWPLDEGKKVKDKFDAIFSATKYIKCLDTIKKQRQDMKLKVKNLREILTEIKRWKDEANRKRSLLQKTKEQETTCEKEREKLIEEIKPILERLRKISTIESDIAKINGEINGKQHQMRSLKESQAELRASLTEDVACDDGELDSMIKDFEHNLAQKERELRQVSCEMGETERQVQGKQREISEAQRKQGELNAMHNTYKNNLCKRNTKITHLADELALSEFTGIEDFNDDKAETMLSKLLTLVDDERTTTQIRKKKFEEDETKIQLDIDELRAQEATLEHDIKTKGNQLDEITKKIKINKQSLMRNESHLAVGNLQDIQNSLVEVEEKITEEEKKTSIPEITENINNSKRKKQDLDLQISEMKRIIGKMNRQAEARSQYDVYTKEKKELENKVEFLKRKDADELEHLLGEIPNENLKNKLDACTSNIRSMTSKSRQEMERLNKRKAQLDTTVKSHKSQIDKKAAEIRELDSMIDSICEGSDFESALDKSRDMKEKLTRERGDLSSSISVLKRFIEKLSQEDCCPLCHRDFGTKDDVLQLIEELEGKVSSVPGKLENVSKKLVEEENRHEQMIQLKPQRDRANKARQELDKLKSQMETDMDELKKVGSDLESKQEILDVSISDEETARRITPDIITIENHLRRIKTLKDQMEDLESTLGNVEGGLSMEEAISRQAELEEEYRKANNRVEQLQEMLQEHKERLQSLKDRKLKLSNEQLTLKTKIQETEKLKDEVKQLEESRKVVEEERETARQEVAPFKYKLRQKNDEKQKVTKEKETYIEKQNSKVNEINEKYRSLHEIQKSIEQYMSKGGEVKLKECEENVKSLHEKVTSLHTRKKTLEEQNRKIDKEITSQKERKRNLDDERKIREKEAEVVVMEKEIKKLEESVKEFDVETLVDEKHELNEKGSRIQNKKASLSGRLEEITSSIRGLETDLRRKEVRDAEKNYKEKLVEMKCIDIASDDINKYYIALDTAVMRFHLDKMQTINGIIRELWRTTYKGNDIDYIEIKTAGSESLGADRRRTYDYRVVMIKNDVEMDMRGRCSAGQKVLASLIIRMALAETFSANCGILALDEPTTNLDRANIDALSQALVQIVNHRISQRNLQLIVITHDTEFLERMTQSDFIDSYYEISRDDKGLSIIRELPANNL